MGVYEKFCEKTGLKRLNKTSSCYGTYGNHLVYMYATSNYYTQLKFSLDCDKDQILNFNEELKSLKNVKFVEYKENILIVNLNIVINRLSYSKLADVLDQIVKIIDKYNCKDICEVSGREDNLNIYVNNGSMQILNDEVANELIQADLQDKSMEDAKDENVLMGILGSFLGAILGGIVGIILFVYLERIAAISGLVIGFLSIIGYAKFSKKYSYKGLIIAFIMSIVSIFVSFYISIALAIAIEFKENVFYVLGILPELISEGFLDDFKLKTLIFKYFTFAIIGVLIVAFSYKNKISLEKKGIYKLN